MFQDHPRRCGENRDSLLPVVFPVGSPPQVRGKRIGAMSATVTNRITPAGAGKTQPHYTAADRQKDHPRRCGENISTCIG